MSFEFLSVDRSASHGAFSPTARSPMEGAAVAAGGTVETVGAWRIVTGFGPPEREVQHCRESVGWADASALGKLEVQADAGELAALAAELSGARPELGVAHRAADAWWCPLTTTRLLIVCGAEDVGTLRGIVEGAAAQLHQPAAVTDVTSVFAAMKLIGPAARETFARFSALDLRPAITPVGALRPGSIARQPGILIREAAERYLFLFGWAIAEYVWAVVEDAATHLGGGPVGSRALAEVEASSKEVPSHA